MSDATHPQLKQVVFNIKKIREFRNYSQEYMAVRMGVTQNAFSKIELGYTNVTMTRLYDIAAALEVEITDLLCLDLSRLQKLMPRKLQMDVAI